jgi:hypothetical protein
LQVVAQVDLLLEAVEVLADIELPLDTQLQQEHIQ